MLNDPNGLGAAAGRMSGGARRAARAALTAAGVLLAPGEVVECAVHGSMNGHDGVLVLAGRRLLMVNDREWRADVAEFPVDEAVTVQGWQDDRSATLVVRRNADAGQLERIGDRSLAVEMAQRIRARVAAPN
ncbi:MAG: hypothetical protein ACT4PW_04850 [Acidimicrobiia bacterium]